MGVRFLRSSFSLSLVLHAFLLIACLLLSAQRAAQHTQSEPFWVEVARTRKVPLIESTKNQIVQSDAGEKVKEAANDAYLGQSTRVVDRETVNREKKTIVGAVKSAPPPSAKIEVGKPKLAQLGVAILPAAKELQNSARDDERWAEVGNTPQDYVRGVQFGDRTALNTKEFVYYGYFQRIRDRLDRAWVPILRARLTTIYKAGRRLASDIDHTTRVIVTLNPQGEITRVSILNESGSRELDEAAIGAFNRAGPFPNPPKGIVDRDGEIKIPWEFILRS